MTTSYCCIFCLNTTKEEGNGNKLPPRFSLQQHHIRKQRHIVIILFFYAIAPLKKTTSHFRHLLLFKHKEDKTHKKTTKRKPKEGRECRAPKFLVDPLEGPSMRQCGRSWNLEHDPDFQH
jgi:hypothetical protein